MDPIERDCQRIEQRYDPENDAGPVTVTDMELMEAVRFLSRRVMELEKIVLPSDPRLKGDQP